MPDLTPEQLKQALRSAVAEVEANMGNILFNAANVGAAQMQFRVFNKGITTAGTNMKYKSAPYKRLRTDAGLQTNHKDLMFTGNLFNSLTILSKSNEQVSYGFNNAETATIRTYQETSDKQVNEPIFDLNEKEEMAMYKAIGKGLGDLIIKTITSYPNKPAKVGADPVEKSKKRNAKKVQKKKAVQKKQALKKRAQKAESRILGVEKQKKALLSKNIQATNAIKKKTQLEAQLKATQSRRVNFDKKKKQLQETIQKRDKLIQANSQKLAKSRSGSKASKEYARKLEFHKSQRENALSNLNNLNSKSANLSKLNKQVETASKRVTRLSQDITKRTQKLNEFKKKTAPKLREEQRKLRAKQKRMGNYKPKKRKKK